MAKNKWPDYPPTLEQEIEAFNRRIGDAPMGAMGPHNKVQIFRRWQRPPPITVTVELPPDDVEDISDLDDYDYQLER